MRKSESGKERRQLDIFMPVLARRRRLATWAKERQKLEAHLPFGVEVHKQQITPHQIVPLPEDVFSLL